MNVIVCDGRSSRKINLCWLIPPLKEIRASMSVRLSRGLLSLLIYFLGICYLRVEDILRRLTKVRWRKEIFLSLALTLAPRPN